MNGTWVAAIGLGLAAVLVFAALVIDHDDFVTETPLGRAGAEGQVEELRSLIQSGAALNEADRHGMTPLAAAARQGQIAAVTILLAAGADPDLAGRIDGRTPLMHAIHKGQNATARLLLDAGQAQGPNLDRALIMAAGYGNAEIVRALLNQGADPRARAADGLSALANAVGGAWDIDYSWGGCATHAATVRALLEAAPDLRVENTFWGRYARFYAKRKGCSEILTLIERPAMIGSRADG